ncbi:hypothetical protein JCM3765_006484 [Sporobolomyces pararoseus]
MLRLVSPPKCISRSSLNKRLASKSPSTSRAMKEWTPGDPIRFQSTHQGHHQAGQEWTPGQAIKFGGEDKNREERAKVQGGKKSGTDIGPSESSLSSASKPLSRRRPSPATSRATFNSSPNSSFEVSGNSSWELSNRWEPPSFASRTSVGDSSCGSTAVFSHSRSYARVSSSSRSVGGSTLMEDEVEEALKLGQLTENPGKEVERVDAAVQTDLSPIRRPLAPKPSKAYLDSLVEGIDFAEDGSSLEFELDLNPTPSTSTPPQISTNRGGLASRSEMEDLLAGVDFTQDLELSDAEESQDTFHSAVDSPVALTPNIISQPHPRSRSPITSRISSSSPRIILRNPRTTIATPPSPPPAMPPQPDVFTLSSTPPPIPRSPIPPKFAPSAKSPKSFPRSSPLVLSSSSQPSTFPPQARNYSISQGHSKNSHLSESSKSKAWDSVVSSIEKASQLSEGDDSVEIIEFKPRSNLNEKAKAKEVNDKENKPPSNASVPTKPGYFVRPASLKPPSTSTSLKPTISSSSSIQDRLHSQPTTRKLRQPQRESFKGRNAEDRYKSALKQYNLQLKYPVHFDYTTWGSASRGGRKPEVVFTTDEQVVEKTLAKLTGPLGFDLEWNAYDVQSRSQGKTALVQVCDQETVLLVQVARMKTFPKSLKTFIEDPSKIKLGVQIAGDARKLERDFGFKPQGLLELNDLTKRFDSQHHARRLGPLIGLQELVGIYLDRYLPKDHSVRCGVWSGNLSEAQKSYGANDVYSSLHVLLALESLITSTTGTSLNLFDFTTPNLNQLPPASASAATARPRSTTASSGKDVYDGPTGLSSLPPRKLQAYQLFQMEKLPLREVTARMSETSTIKHTSVLWNLLGIYASTASKDGGGVEWDEERLVEAVDSLGGLFTGRMAAEHGEMVKDLRKKVVKG